MYTHLQRLGICLSHPATILAIKKMGIDYDKAVLDWTSQLSQQPVSLNVSNFVIEPTNSSDEEDLEDFDNESEVMLEASDGKSIPLDRTVSIIGDNLDKNISPRDMRSSNQVKSIHPFHSVATVGRVKTLSLEDKNPIGDIREVPVSAFLPSAADCSSISDLSTLWGCKW